MSQYEFYIAVADPLPIGAQVAGPKQMKITREITRAEFERLRAFSRQAQRITGDARQMGTYTAASRRYAPGEEYPDAKYFYQAEAVHDPPPAA